MTMLTLYEAIKSWADGQNTLDAADGELRGSLQSVVEMAVLKLHRHRSLADLASDFCDSSSLERWWMLLGQEFALDSASLRAARGAAYWQRFMELRHPSRRRSMATDNPSAR